MGLLKDKRTISWNKIQLIKDKVKERGVEQFIKVYKKFKDKKVKKKWGYEVEMMLCAFEDKNIKLLLCGEKLIEKLSNQNLIVHPEYAAFMLELTPKEPYDDDLMDFCIVEYFLQKSFNVIKNNLQCLYKDAFPLKMSILPRFGVGNSFATKEPKERICMCENQNLKKRDLCMCKLHKKILENDDDDLEASNSNLEIFSLKKSGNNFEDLMLYQKKEHAKKCMQTCEYKDFNFWERAYPLKYSETNSVSFPDNSITDHPRFFSFNKNFLKRRGKQIEGYIKVFDDEKTEKTQYKEDDSLLLDSFGHGMGCSCLQITIQPACFVDSLFIYDQMAIISPLLLRLTRATPFFNGYLTETETRWDLISFSTDDRTDEERGIEYLKTGNYYNGGLIPKSRYSSIDLFISNHPSSLSEYNDIKVPKHEEALEVLRNNGVEEKLANHISSLFIRDPMMVYEDALEFYDFIQKKEIIEPKDDDKRDLEKLVKKMEIKTQIFDNKNKIDTKEVELTVKEETLNDKKIIKEKLEIKEEKLLLDDFLNIQSSNWRSVRYKQPSEEENDGWKIEVRTMEVQITAFEITAVSIFTYLLSTSLIFYNVNLYIPISLVDENFKRANLHLRKKEEYFKKLEKDNAKFYYRENIFNNEKAIIKEGTLDEIFNGTNEYKGLISLVKDYINEVFLGNTKLHEYINFISKKTSGEYLSTSEYFRKFIFNHKDYRNDSKIPKTVENELIAEVKKYSANNDYSYLKN